MGTPQHPTLVQTLDRCGCLGLLACTLAPDGTLTDIRAPHALWWDVIDAPAMRAALRTVVLGAIPACLRGKQTPVPMGPGIRLAVCPVSDERGLHGANVVLLLTPTAGANPALRDACEHAGLGAECAPRLVNASATYDEATASIICGLLDAQSDDVVAIGRRDAELEGFTKQLTGAFETIDLLYSLGRAMKAPFSPAEFLTSLCARARVTLSFAWTAVHFASTPKTPLSLQGMLVAHGMLPADDDEFRAALAPAMFDNDTSCKIRTSMPGLTSPDSPQVIVQPLLCKGHQIGVLAAGGKFGEDSMVSSYDTQLVEACAGFLSTFIENVALYDEQHELFMGTLGALVAAIDAKDRYTCGHSERVALLSMQLAQAAGLPEAQCERVRIAGLVHDLGKIGVPEHVLLKKGRLTDEEFAHIKKHPELGFKILQQVPLLSDVLPGVLYHHERIDGKGYPEGLTGSDIPLLARIIAVADTFDAMSSDRSYRSRLPREQVLAEIARCGGSQLDQRLAQLMQGLDLSMYDALSQRHAAADDRSATALAA